MEPGCYFIDALLIPAMGSPNTTKFFNHEAVGRFKGFGGVRIESDVVLSLNSDDSLLLRFPVGIFTFILTLTNHAFY